MGERLSRFSRRAVGALASLALLGCAGISSSEPTAINRPITPPKPASPEPASPNPASPDAIANTTPPAPDNSAAPASTRQIPLVTGLNHPWGMAWLPDGSLLITERRGTLQRISWPEGQARSLLYGNTIISGAVVDRPTVESVAGVPAVFAAGQGGLLDVVLHPNFAENQQVYFTYSAGDRQANRTQVARARLVGNRLQNWEVIFANADAKSDTQHFGARLAWLPDGTLLVALGDGGNPPVSFGGDLIRQQAQNLGTHFGKVLRLKDDGSVPADNPFVGQPGAKPEIWSYGHRNIQGLAVDPETGNVWATEHGSRGGDELNRLEAGQNYGWPLVSASKEYTSDRPVAPTSSKPGFVDPLLEWTPSIAPSGLAIYRGETVPGWQGNLFAGALRFQEVRRIGVDATGQVRALETIAFDQRIRDVRQGPDGLLYVLTDDSEGKLIRLEPDN